MRKSLLSSIVVFSTILSLPINLNAQSSDIIHSFVFDDIAVFYNLSDNGKWGVAVGMEDVLWRYPKLMNLETDEVTELLTGDDYSNASAGAFDVTDDGSIIAGSYDDKPAVYFVESERWSLLEIPDSAVSGICEFITPDGHYAVGTCWYSFIYNETVAMWDLENDGELVELPNISAKDMLGDDNGQRRLIGISPDGNTLLGCVSYSYPGSMWYFVYDVAKQECKPIGFDIEELVDADSTIWTARHDSLLFIYFAYMSANGKYITGAAYMNDDVGLPFLYNIETDEFIIYDDDNSSDYPGWSVTSDGYVLAAGPMHNPYREWSVRVGEYWYPITQIMQQQYGLDLLDETNFTNSGTPMAVSDDGKVIGAFVSPTSENYILTLPEPIQDASNGVDLLGSYTVSPVSGGEFSSIKTATLTFDYNLELLGDKSDVTFTDADGNSLGSIVTVKVSEATLTISFRNANLQEGVTYYLKIAAGTLAISGDSERINKEITITYKGRADAPVEMVSVSPVENSSVTQLNYTTNPVMITFDTNLTLNSDAKAYLYKDDETSPDVTLSMGVADNVLYVFPTSSQYLYLDHTYRVVVPDSTVFDIMGNNGNDSIVLTYYGLYERSISYDTDTIYADDFSSGVANMMLYEGDHNQPTDSMLTLDFDDADNYPWTVVTDNDNLTDYAAASTSMYEPAGRSDDWMVLPHLYMPDDRCYIQFDVQSFWFSKTDTLIVLVWDTDDEYSSMNDDRIALFKAECDTLYLGVESPGYVEDYLAGDWTERKLSLAAYSERSIYIAFVNSNFNQSCIFLDNILVRQDQQFQIAVTTEETVINAESVPVSGQVRITSSDKTFSTISLTLYDAEGNQIDQITEEGLSLDNGDTYPFAFETELPLTVGEENTYSISVQLDDEKSEPKYTVKNLAFQTYKRVMLEEGTGRDCVNCPQGILAIENLESVYGEQFIPVSIHTYDGDPLGDGFSSYATFLNISAYPSGVVNRKQDTPIYSMTSDDDGNATFSDPSDPLWLDAVAEEMEEGAEADFDIESVVLGSDSIVTMTCTYKFALNKSGQNMNVFIIALEDSCLSYQRNAYYSSTDPAFGEWGYGGIYASATVRNYYFMDVVRGLIATTYYGTPGFIESDVVAGEEYTTTIQFELPTLISDNSHSKYVAVLIDTNTGYVVNVDVSPLTANYLTSVGQISDAAQTEVEIDVDGSTVRVSTVADAQVVLYGIDGTLIASAEGAGTVSLSAGGYKGVALLKVIAEGQTTVRKVIIK